MLKIVGSASNIESRICQDSPAVPSLLQDKLGLRSYIVGALSSWKHAERTAFMHDECSAMMAMSSAYSKIHINSE